MSVQAAAGAVDITPPVGGPVHGWTNEKNAERIHSRMRGKVLVLKEGPASAGLVTLDLFGMEAPWVDRVRQSLASRSGIPAHRWMICPREPPNRIPRIV